MERKLKVALVGLGFGGCFAEIYKEHPNVSELVLFDIDKARENEFKNRLGITSNYDTFEDVLADVTKCSSVECREALRMYCSDGYNS